MDKKLNAREFREKGYLQELNRRFLHPLGLAIEIKVEDDGTEVLGGIWDSRDDEEGIYYDLINSNTERNERFSKNKEFIDNEIEKRKEKREILFGDFIEKIKKDE